MLDHNNMVLGKINSDQNFFSNCNLRQGLFSGNVRSVSQGFWILERLPTREMMACNRSSFRCREVVPDTIAEVSWLSLNSSFPRRVCNYNLQWRLDLLCWNRSAFLLRMLDHTIFPLRNVELDQLFPDVCRIITSLLLEKISCDRHFSSKCSGKCLITFILYC